MREERVVFAPGSRGSNPMAVGKVWCLEAGPPSRKDVIVEPMSLLQGDLTVAASQMVPTPKDRTGDRICLLFSNAGPL